MGLSVSVTGERYGRECVGTIAIAAIDIQHYTLTGVEGYRADSRRI